MGVKGEIGLIEMVAKKWEENALLHSSGIWAGEVLLWQTQAMITLPSPSLPSKINFALKAFEVLPRVSPSRQAI